MAADRREVHRKVLHKGAMWCNRLARAVANRTVGARVGSSLTMMLCFCLLVFFLFGFVRGLRDSFFEAPRLER